MIHGFQVSTDPGGNTGPPARDLTGESGTGAIEAIYGG